MRLQTLDSARGLAALGVVLHHTYLALNSEFIGHFLDRWWNPLRTIAMGRSFVILFFVLSGFVLTLSLTSTKQTYASYILRRVTRLLLPYAASILFSCLLFSLINGLRTPSSLWPAKNWPSELEMGTVLGGLGLIGSKHFNSLNSIAWSLVYEARISIFLPLIAAITGRKSLIASLVAALALLMASWIALMAFKFDTTPYANESVTEALVTTIYFVPFFIAGSALANHRMVVSATFCRLPAFARALGWIFAIMMMTRHSDFTGFIGSVTLICLCISTTKTESRVIVSPPLIWLGRVSYSLYLVHIPILFAIPYLFEGTLSFQAATFLAVPISIIVSFFFYRLVEEPSHNLGRWLARRWPATGAARQSSSSDMIPS
jgi:peptidoglycan/LPS O-acetylase OafA/YrhL